LFFSLFCCPPHPPGKNYRNIYSEAGAEEASLRQYMKSYSKEEKLLIYKRIGVTKEIYVILRNQKRKQKISMAKIVCNAIAEKYE